MRFQMKGFMVFGMPLLAVFSLLIPVTGAGELPGGVSVKPIADEWAKQYKLPSSFFEKGLMVEDIFIATSGLVSDHAILESAYLFEKMMKSIAPEVAGRIRDKRVLCILVGHSELTSDIPQFKTLKTGKELDFYNWRQRGFLRHVDGRPVVLFAEEDVLEYSGGMQDESILIHEFGHVIHGAGFDQAQQKRLTEAFGKAKARSVWNDGRAAQRFRRVQSDTPVSLLEALVKSFPDQPRDFLAKCLDAGDITVNGAKVNSRFMVNRNDQVLIIFGGRKECYAGKNRSEYWAEGVQCWYDTNRTMDHDHNHIHTREGLKRYDPGLASLCREVLGDNPWRFVSPRKRAGKGHLEGFSPEDSPKVEDLPHIRQAALDYYDEYWSGYWERLRSK
jgi:hypothetical protein